MATQKQNSRKYLKGEKKKKKKKKRKKKVKKFKKQKLTTADRTIVIFKGPFFPTFIFILSGKGT